MGEVYRARDTKLGREVAIKVLPEEFSRDKERLTRFEREAKLLASLNHTNIATLYGHEESNDRQLLVMELVEGETLAERIARGPIPADEAIELFIQIAEGLEAAHEKGVIHRDLKPANIKITPEGKIKILDFGLAKAFSPEEEGSAASSQSPTLTKGTALGAIMGTASYMSPEQARGKSVDKRTDVWAFACCLYEALTARKAFEGETITDILAAVVHKEPSFERLPLQRHAGVERLLRRCVAKNARERYHDIADVRIELKGTLNERPQVSPTGTRSRTPLVAMALVTVAALGIALWSVTRTSPIPARPVARFALPLPSDQELGITITGASVAISRDDQQFAWVARSDDTRRLYLRSATDLEAKRLEGTEDARAPFFSPDGRWLGFMTGRAIWKVSVSGGAPVKITDFTGTPRGATWASDGSIIFTYADSLHRVSSDGGVSEMFAAPVREKREKSLRFPDPLPGGRAVLFTMGTADMEMWDDATIAVVSIDNGEIRTLIEGGTNARYSSTGHIVYARGQRLLAVPFDASSLEVTGTPVVILEPVSTFPINGPAQFALSPAGSLVYAPGPAWTSTGRIVLVNRRGEVEPLVETPRPISSARIAPGGGRLAIEIQGANHSIWTYNMARGALTPLISGYNNFWPLWSPDGSALAWSHDARGVFDVFLISADGSGERERLTPVDGPPAFAESWSPDGLSLLYSTRTAETQSDIMMLSLGENRTPRGFLGTDANESDPRFSPDGEWVAHSSDESGRSEIYLRSFRDPGPKWQVSTEGGIAPHWNPRGGELFYRVGGKMMAVDIGLNDAPEMGQPRLLFEKPIRSSNALDYDVMADGNRFIMIDDSEALPRPTELVFVRHFAEELKRLAPTER